jgi:two-component sensor histidine kinase
LEFEWRESGGPRIDGPPQRTGFGTLLARRSVQTQLEGALGYDWQVDGLCVRMSLPIAKVTRLNVAPEDIRPTLRRSEATGLGISP